jgi:hypothetical protein
MKRILTLLSLIASLFTAKALAENLKASTEAGYTTHYMVNGLARTDAEAFAGVKLGASYYTIDAYLGGTIIPTSNGLDESHWMAGLGRGFKLIDGINLRVDTQAFRHQTSILGAPDSTEVAAIVALENVVVTPYIKGSHDLNLEQSGYIVGLKRPTDVFGLFTLTPSAEYGKFSDYETISAKIGVSRVFFNHLEPFAEVGYYDNHFSVSNYNFAVKELNGTVVAMGGIRWNF